MKRYETKMVIMDAGSLQDDADVFKILIDDEPDTWELKSTFADGPFVHLIWQREIVEKTPEKTLPPRSKESHQWWILRTRGGGYLDVRTNGLYVEVPERRRAHAFTREEAMSLWEQCKDLDHPILGKMRLIRVTARCKVGK